MASIDPAVDPRGARWEARLRVPVLGAALLAVPAVVLYLAAKSGPVATTAVVLSWVVWLVFLAEATIMLRVVADRRAWMRGHVLALLILVGSFPLLIDVAEGLLAARAIKTTTAVRLLQGLYLLKIAKLFKAVWVLHRKLDGRARLAVYATATCAVPVAALLAIKAF